MRLVDIDDIRVMKFLPEDEDPSESDGEREYRNGWNDAITAIDDIQPSAEPDDAALHESCTDCPLYDHDRHSCPRFNRVIPMTILEVQQHWIPVTERLPEDVQIGDEYPIVIFCTKKKTYTGFYEYYLGGRWLTADCDSVVDGVIAWRPLPRPWEGEANED